MKDFTLESLWAIAEEMLGWMLWLGIAAAAVVSLLIAAALLRQHGFKGRAARNAMLVGLLGAVAAMIAAPLLTQAGFDNVHGMVDWIFLALIGIGAFAAVTLAAFGILDMLCRNPVRS